jgi:selenide,water dikinase
VLALNVAAFPEDMAPEIVAQVLQGGADKVAEAGGISRADIRSLMRSRSLG